MTDEARLLIALAHAIAQGHPDSAPAKVPNEGSMQGFAPFNKAMAYTDEVVTIISQGQSLLIRMHKPDSNPVVMIKEDGEVIRWHGQTKQIEGYIRSVASKMIAVSQPRGDLRDFDFRLDEGEVIRDGKGHYPILMRVNIPTDRLFEFGMDFLRRYENSRHNDRYPEWVEFALFGDMHELDRDGYRIPMHDDGKRPRYAAEWITEGDDPIVGIFDLHAREYVWSEQVKEGYVDATRANTAAAQALSKAERRARKMNEDYHNAA
jgi:hypothetical protein